jgi:hypothetical protein
MPDNLRRGPRTVDGLEWVAIQEKYAPEGRNDLQGSRKQNWLNLIG